MDSWYGPRRARAVVGLWERELRVRMEESADIPAIERSVRAVGEMEGTQGEARESGRVRTEQATG
jgi:hypothetical protein